MQAGTVARHSMPTPARVCAPVVETSQVWTAGRLHIRVLDVRPDGRVWFRTSMHPEQGMTGVDFLAWLRAIRAVVSLTH